MALNKLDKAREIELAWQSHEAELTVIQSPEEIEVMNWIEDPEACQAKRAEVTLAEAVSVAVKVADKSILPEVLKAESINLEWFLQEIVICKYCYLCSGPYYAAPRKPSALATCEVLSMVEAKRLGEHIKECGVVYESSENEVVPENELRLHLFQGKSLTVLKDEYNDVARYAI